MNDEIAKQMLDEMNHHNDLLERLVLTAEMTWGSVHEDQKAALKAKKEQRKRGSLLGIVTSEVVQAQEARAQIQRAQMQQLGNKVKLQ